MRRNLTSLLLGLTMAFALVGCSSGNAPNVTPTPSNTVMPSGTPYLDKDANNDTGKPDVTDDAQYDANADGRVEGTAVPEGSVARAMDKAGNTVRRAVDETGDAVRNTVDRAVH